MHHSIVIVPSRFLNEIKNQPEHVLSFQKQVSERFIGKYTGLGVNDTLVHSVKVGLTKNIARFLGELQDEVDYSVKEHIGDCPGKLHTTSFLSGLLMTCGQTGSQFAFIRLFRRSLHSSQGASLLGSR